MNNDTLVSLIRLANISKEIRREGELYIFFIARKYLKCNIKHMYWIMLELFGRM